MDHTGETGDQIEFEAGVVELDAEVAIEAVLDDDEVEHDAVEDDEIEHEATDAVEATEPEAAEDDAEADTVDAVAIEDPAIDAIEEQRVESRHRHPAAAAALAKRVAMDRSARVAVGSLVLVAFLFLFVFPTRSYLAEQRQVRDACNSVQVLRAQNEELAREAKRLQTDSEIEQLARSQFNMVFEGEEAYNVVPPEGSPTTTTKP